MYVLKLFEKSDLLDLSVVNPNPNPYPRHSHSQTNEPGGDQCDSIKTFPYISLSYWK